MNENDRHSRMLLPTWYDPLPTTQGSKLPSVSALWERAKEMFGRAVGQLKPLGCLATRAWMKRAERRDFREWVEPVEAMLRSCIVAKAIAFLTMTPEGLKLLRNTPKTGDPSSSRKHAPTPHKVTVPHPGWHTVAKQWQPPAPETPAPPQPEFEAPKYDRRDPATWRAAFRVTRWHPGHADVEEARTAALNRAIDPEHYLISPDLDDVSVRSKHKPRAIEEPGAHFARRIESITRAFADPSAAIMRTARFLAGLTLQALRGFRTANIDPRWIHGFRDNMLARRHTEIALSMLIRTADPEPG